jgi:hypothetical protein
MIRLGLRFLCWVWDDESEIFDLIRTILESREMYPMYQQLNTRRFIHTALMYRMKRGQFTGFHLSVLKRVANGR